MKKNIFLCIYQLNMKMVPCSPGAGLSCPSISTSCLICKENFSHKLTRKTFVLKTLLILLNGGRVCMAGNEFPATTMLSEKINGKKDTIP